MVILMGHTNPAPTRGGVGNGLTTARRIAVVSVALGAALALTVPSAAMAADPILIGRPLVETDLGVRLGRPPERVKEILPG